MKKIFTLMLAIVAVVTVSAKQVVFDFTNPEALGITPPAEGAGTNISGQDIVVDDVTMSNVKVATTDNRIWNSKGSYDFRMYANSTLTFKAEANINAIEFAGSAIGFSEISGSAWAGDADSVTFTANMTNKITKITLYIGEQPEIWIPDTVSVSEARALIDSADVHDHFVIGVVAGTPFSTGSWSGKVCFWMTDGQNAADSLEAFQVYAKNNARWNSLDEAKEELQKGDTVLVYAQKLELYAAKNFYEINGGYYAEKLGSAPVVPVTGDTVSVAEAIAIADTLPANKNSEESYFVEGYAVNVEAYNTQYNNQAFFLVDDAAQPDSLFKAYRAVPKKDGKAYPVLAGDKLRLYGQLQKYVKDSVAQLEIVNATVEFLEEVEGDRTIEEPTEQMDTITVARALEIGKALSSGGVSSDKYVIDGYVSSIIDYYSEQYGNETFWIADEKGSRAASTASGAFEIYRGKPSTGAEIGLDAKIRIACKIKNYNGTIENDGVNIVFEVLEQGHEETFDTITVAKALEIGQALDSAATTSVQYVIKGYVSSIEQYYDSTYKNETFWMTDEKGSRAASNAEGAFEVFRGKPDIQEEIGLDAFVFVKAKIQNFRGSVIETAGTPEVTVVEKGHEETIDSITVAKALEIGLALGDKKVTEKRYAITGYVSSIVEYFSEQYGNETFWITDSLGSRAKSSADGAFEVYRGKPNTGAEIGRDAKIVITCKIKNYGGTIENDGTNVVFEVLEPGREITFDTITVEQAMAIGNALEDNATTEEDYVVKGFAVKAYEPDSGYTNQNFYMADFIEDYGEFYAYRCTPDYKIETGDYVLVLGKIQKYVGSKGTTIELSYGKATHAEAPKIDTIKVSVAEALEIGNALEKDTKTSGYYLVRGFVANITREFDEEENNQSFLLSDDPEAETGEFLAELARIEAPGAELHQEVTVFGKIQKYEDEEGAIVIRIEKGSAKVVTNVGIENVVLTKQATKVIVDGVLYIVRDNKMYNVQGTQVR
jgi:hypothetical protein